MKYISTKFYKDLAPLAYRQWKATGTNCSLIHGYCLSFYLEFECDDLDSRNWCVDFGGLSGLKNFLETHFDHVLLCAEDDPHKNLFLQMQEAGIAKIEFVEKTGCEGIANYLYEYINTIYIPTEFGSGESSRVWCSKIEVIENEKNSAMRVGHRSDNEF